MAVSLNSIRVKLSEALTQSIGVYKLGLEILEKGMYTEHRIDLE